MPSFPEVPVDEYAPTLISARVQEQILAEIPWDRRGAFLAARLGIRPGEIRATDVTDYRIVERVPGLTISRAVKGPNANAPTRGTKGRSAAWIPVDEALQHWIERRLLRVSKEEILRSRIALFPNPSARNREKRWIANALREEWNRAAETVGVRVRMYEGTKHSSATAWLAQGSSLHMIQRMLRRDAAANHHGLLLRDPTLTDEKEKPDISTLEKTGHLYFGPTRNPFGVPIRIGHGPASAAEFGVLRRGVPARSRRAFRSVFPFAAH